VIFTSPEGDTSGNVDIEIALQKVKLYHGEYSHSQTLFHL
jgi:hypothetical protein